MDPLTLEAAQLATAMLRFQEPLAHLMASHTPEGLPVIGVDAYKFVPSPRTVLRAEIPAFLAGLPGPAFLAATTMRGIVSLTLLNELTGERGAAMEHDLKNQRDGLATMAPGPDTDRVLLEFDDESHLFSLAAVRRWAEQFAINAGWNISPCPDKGRAEWQINLIGGDGHRYSKGIGRPGTSR